MSTEMKKTKNVELTLGEVAQLNNELVEILKEPKISFVLKYDISKLFNKVSELTRAFRKQEIGIYEKFGVCVDEKEKKYSLVGSEKFEEGMAELEKLYAKKESFVESFELKKFEEVESSYPYIYLMKFLN